MSTDAKLNDPYTGDSTVSSFMNYGSYSGADIKVIVHYPYPYSQEKNLEKELKKARSRLQKKLEEKDENQGDPVRIARIQEELTAINDEIQRLEDEKSTLGDLPTSKVLGEISTISWSIFREKAPVRTLGSVYPRSFCRGPRTIGGSMIFTVFHKHALHEILNLGVNAYNTGTTDIDSYQYTTNLADQLPPLDLTLIFSNEYGALSTMGIYGVEFLQEGSTFSIEDIYSENVIQYVARDLDPLRVISEREVVRSGLSPVWSTTASNLHKDKDGLHETIVRRNPFA